MEKNPPTLPRDSSDIAWVTIPCPQSPEQLRTYFRDPEVLLRVNPYYVFKRCRAVDEDHIQVEYRNESNQLDYADLVSIIRHGDSVLEFRYPSGLKQRTYFIAEPAPTGSQLVVVDDYDGIDPSERERRQAEVDRSLVAWGEGFRRYFMRQNRYRWIPGWSAYIRKIWVPMKPSQRRIVWLIWLFSCFDLAIVALGFGIWFIEFGNR